MCGIAGFLHFDKSRTVEQSILKRMTDSIRHRGPDGEGFYCNENIALGHRRLSIIDLDTGDQPMFSEDKSIAIIFNGEIYNYIELRDELKSLGHHFHTNSDTEVIIKSYQQWGKDFQNKLNGMWSLAIWNDKEQELLLSIDRMGEKPMYYTVFENTLVFGSEIKALKAYGCPTEPNWEMTELYFSMLYIPAPFTFFKSISKLEPAHFLIVKGGQVQKKSYWDIPQVSEKEMITDKKYIYRQFEELFYDAVKIRMRSDVPFGAFLSGGLDSSSIVATMAEISDFPVQTFTIGFKEKAFDESKLAMEVALKFKTDHHLNIVEPSSFEEALEKVAYHYDEPFGDSSAIPTGYVAGFARQNVKMVLTGDGGDEVLSGYTTYQGEKFASQYQKLPSFLQKSITKTSGFIANNLKGNSLAYKLRRIENLSKVSQLPFIERLADKAGFYGKDVAKKLTQELHTISIEDYLSDFFKGCTFKDNFYKLMYFNLKNSLPFDMLVKVDRMSMANSLETRVPFLDYRLVELMTRVSKNIKMEGYERKSILRNTVAKKLPENLLKAGKKGFGVPLREWFKDKSFEKTLDNLQQSDFGLNNTMIRQIIDDNKKGIKDNGNLIWMLFVLKKCFNPF